MAFKIGDIVMRLDGDGRPHKIVDITVHYPLNSREHTFFQYHYEDGGSDISDSRYIVPYNGKYRVMEVNEVVDFFSVHSKEEVAEIDKCIERKQKEYDAKLRDKMMKAKDFPMTD